MTCKYHITWFVLAVRVLAELSGGDVSAASTPYAFACICQTQSTAQ